MILIVNKMYPPEIGGVEVVTKTIAEILAEKYDVTVLTFNKENKFKNEKVKNIEILRLPSFFTKDPVRLSLDYKKEFKKLASKAQSIIFNFPSGSPELFPSLYKRLKVKKICFYHSDIVNRGLLGWYYNNFFVRRFLNVMDVIITTSPNMAESSKYLKDFKSKIKVIPLFVDISHFYPRHSEKRREILSKFSDKAEKIVLYIGRLSWYKGLQYLVSSMKLLDEKYVLVMVGEGAMKEKLLDITKKNHLEDRVLFEKHVPYSDLPHYYSAADVFVLPSTSRAEAFGLVVLEAMACGTPVVTTELGTGTSYHNVSGKTGLVVPPADPQALAKAIKEICENNWKEARAELIISRAKEFSLEKFKSSILEVISGEDIH